MVSAAWIELGPGEHPDIARGSARELTVAFPNFFAVCEGFGLL